MKVLRLLKVIPYVGFLFRNCPYPYPNYTFSRGYAKNPYSPPQPTRNAQQIISPACSRSGRAKQRRRAGATTPPPPEYIRPGLRPSPREGLRIPSISSVFRQELLARVRVGGPIWQVVEGARAISSAVPYLPGQCVRANPLQGLPYLRPTPIGIATTVGQVSLPRR